MRSEAPKTLGGGRPGGLPRLPGSLPAHHSPQPRPPSAPAPPIPRPSPARRRRLGPRLQPRSAAAQRLLPALCRIAASRELPKVPPFWL